MFEISEDNENHAIVDGARILVIGVGGGGGNAVNTMIRSGLTGVDYVVANTDAQSLKASLAEVKIQLGADLTKGLGAGANPEVGRKAALDEYEKLSELINEVDMVFITAGMGGGTGTGAAPVIAKLAKELGALTVGVVTKPFIFEGRKRFKQAEAGISVLEECVDSLITIPNQRLLYLAGESLSLVDTFKKADEVLLNAVRGISDLINNTGHINADFADVNTVMANKGLALMGTGFATGPDRAIKAASDAISSPLLEDVSIDGATGIIINITGNDSLTMHETNEAVTLIMEAADEDAEIIFGTVIDDSMEDDIKVTVVATGLGGGRKSAAVNIEDTRAAVSSPTAPVQASTILEAPLNEMPARATEMATEKTVETMTAPVVEVTSTPREEEIVAASTQAPTALEQAIAKASSEMSARNEQQEAAAPRQKSPMEMGENGEDRPASSYNVSTRARSIAEKLGFISYDEDELDTPSFLRNENGPEKTL